MCAGKKEALPLYIIIRCNSESWAWILIRMWLAHLIGKAQSAERSVFSLHNHRSPIQIFWLTKLWCHTGGACFGKCAELGWLVKCATSFEIRFRWIGNRQKGMPNKTLKKLLRFSFIVRKFALVKNGTVVDRRRRGYTRGLLLRFLFSDRRAGTLDASPCLVRRNIREVIDPRDEPSRVLFIWRREKSQVIGCKKGPVHLLNCDERVTYAVAVQPVHDYQPYPAPR